jgi:hypothetical protein
MHKCKNNSDANVYHLEQMVGNFFPYSQEQLGFDKPVTIIFQSDKLNSSKMLGKTAYYDPENQEVVLFVDGRHPKDIMRSLSHELVHHAQNCRGDFTNAQETTAGYAQKDPHLRNMEREAYTKGNLIFRDYEDLIKTGKINIEIDFSESGEPKMSLKEWKNNEINQKLMKKWGLLKEEKNEPADVAHADRVLSGEEAGEDAAEELDETSMKYRKEDDWGKSPAAFTGTEKEEEEATDHLKHGKALEEDSEGEETYHYGEDEGRDEKELRDLERRHATRAHIKALKRDMDYDEDHERRRERGTHFREAQEEIEEGAFGWKSADEKRKELADRPAFSPGGPQEDDPGVDPPMAHALEKDQTAKEPPSKRRKRPRIRATDVAASRGSAAGSKNVFTMGENSRKISVKEAKEITRRIIERIKREVNE